MTQLQSTRHDGAVKPGHAPRRAAGPHDPPERARNSWVVRLPVDALDARPRPTPDRHKLLMRQILEGYARDKPVCWPGNDELARAYGCEDAATVRRLLAALEADGVLLRVPTE